MKVKINVQDIVDKLIQYKKSYYTGESEVSDKEFDDLEDSLRAIDPTNEYFALVGSPTIVGDKRTHKIAMGSQSKVKIEDNGIKEVCERFISQDSTIVSYKMDGISAAVDYKDGMLQFATTRGDGFIGEDIPNPEEFRNIPEVIDERCEFTARCELVIHYDDFEIINAQLPDDEKFSNPRNAVAGIARKVDSPFRKYITAYYYDAVGDFVVDWKEMTFGFLIDAFGIEAVVPYFIDMTNNEFRALAEKLDKTRKELPYMIDGLVIEFSSLEKMQKLGVANGNKPKGSVALKFNAVAETTHVTDVVWQVGTTGNLTPVVEFEPTLIDGSIVRRASIHNWDIYQEWGFRKGDVISVQKNNDIIPQVKDLIDTDPNNEDLDAPTNCPVCDSELQLIKVAKTTNLVCTNPTCVAKYIGTIKKWATKSGMASKGVGDAFFEAYACSEDFSGPWGLYDMSVMDIMDLSDRYKEKSATKIYNAIQSSKTMKLMDFFGGLNIHGCGSRTFKKVIDAFDVRGNDYKYACQCILNPNLSSLVDGIGEVTAKSMRDGIIALNDTINTLAMIVEFEVDEAPNEDAKSFLFTGSFNTIDPDTGKGYKRKALEALVASKGHEPASSVKKGLDYLVTSDPDSTSSKMEKARKNGVTILGEDKFFGMMGK